MAQHIRNQHIRAQPQQHVREKRGIDGLKDYFSGMYKKHIRTSPGQTMTGFIIVLILLILVLIVVALHFFGFIKVPQMSDLKATLTATPKSHLQYFFF